MLLLPLEFPRRKAHRRFVLYDIVEEQSAAGENPRQRPSFSASSALTHFAAQAANGYKIWRTPQRALPQTELLSYCELKLAVTDISEN